MTGNAVKLSEICDDPFRRKGSEGSNGSKGSHGPQKLASRGTFEKPEKLE